MCSANFQGLFYNSPCSKHAASSAASPGLALSLGSSWQCCVSQSQVPPLDIMSPMALVPILPMLRSLGCWKRGWLWPHALLSARVLLPPHELIPAEATAGIASLWEAAACQTHSWQPCLAATATNQPHSRPWPAKPPKAAFVSGYTLQQDMSTGIWAWKLRLQLQGFHTKAYQFPSSARVFKLPEEEISWPVPTITPCRFLSSGFTFSSFWNQFLLTLFFHFLCPLLIMRLSLDVICCLPFARR